MYSYYGVWLSNSILKLLLKEESTIDLNNEFPSLITLLLKDFGLVYEYV